MSQILLYHQKNLKSIYLKWTWLKAMLPSGSMHDGTNEAMWFAFFSYAARKKLYRKIQLILKGSRHSTGWASVRKLSELKSIIAKTKEKKSKYDIRPRIRGAKCFMSEFYVYILGNGFEITTSPSHHLTFPKKVSPFRKTSFWNDLQ